MEANAHRVHTEGLEDEGRTAPGTAHAGVVR